ncbi:MAG: ABC transporter substrate-binding protein [Clostridia bacterium]|nr:ABC transporter substrate-binding protein [Clostridia bacterium]
MKKLFCTLLCIFTLTGCSFDFLKTEQTENPAPEPLQTEAVPEAAASENVLNTALCTKAEFQPHSESNKINRQSLSLVYEPLFYADAELNPVPALATGLEAHGNTVDIYMRENVIWHDGSHFSAADAAYSINLVASGYSVYKNTDIISAKAKNSNCVTVTLSRSVPNPELLFTFPVVKNKAPQSMTEPNGTGPFRFSGKESYDTYVFSAFDGYYGQKPAYSAVRMINARDEKRVKQLFDAGETDVYVIGNETMSSYTPRVNTKIYEYTLNNMIFIGFNTEKIPAEIRRAVRYAADRSAITEKVLSRTAVFSDIPMIPSPATAQRASENVYSIERAENEMLAGGYERQNGMYKKGGSRCTLRFLLENDEEYGALFDKLSKKLNNFGIECVKETTDYYYERLNSGDFDAVIGSWQLDTDMSVILGAGNVFSYENPELQRLMTSWGETKNADINAAFDIIAADAPIIPIAFKKAAVSISPKITSVPSPSFAFPLYGIGSWTLQ